MHTKKLTTSTILFLVIGVSLSSQDMTIPGRVAQNDGKPLRIDVVRDTEPISLTKLSTSAELVVMGRLSRLESYLSDDQYDVYTDYELIPKQVIKDRAGRQTPGATKPLIVTLFGGELDVNGTPVKVEDSSLIKWDDDTDLLLFLARNDKDLEKFRLYGGKAGLFEVERGTQRVKSLLNHPRRDQDVRGEALEQVVQRVQAARPEDH